MCVTAMLALSFATTLCALVNAGDVLELFVSNPPDYVNVSDARSDIQQLVDKVSDRLLCTQHGVEPSECAQCLNSTSVMQGLDIDENAKQLTSENAQDLSLLFLHHFLEFRSLCRKEPYGCRDFTKCQAEILDMVYPGYLGYSMEWILKSLREVLDQDPRNKCFGVEEILQELYSSDRTMEMDGIDLVRKVVTILIGHILQGHCIELGVSTSEFLDDIFHMYGDHCLPVITIDGLKRLVSDLQNQGHHHDHSHDHNSLEHDHHHHDHSDCPHGHSHSVHHHSHADHDHSNHENNHLDHHSHPDLPDHIHASPGKMKKDSKIHHHEQNKHHDGHTHEQEHEHDHDHSHDEHDHLHDDHSHDHNHTSDSHDDHNHTSHTHDDIHPDEKHSESLEDSLEDPLDSLNHTNPFTDDKLYDLSEGNKSTDSAKNNDTEENETDSKDSAESSERSRREAPIEHQMRPPPFDTFLDVSTESESSPASALVADLSHPEMDSGEKKDFDVMMDDVRKVYLQKTRARPVELQMSEPSINQKHENLAAKCMDVEELVSQFRFASNSSLSKEEFMQICPAIVQQVVSGACHRHAAPQPKPTQWELYVYSCLSVLLISMTSLAGVVLLPILTRQAYHYVMAGCYGLAFSTLAGDALIHLLPQVLGAHSHGPGEDGHHSHGEDTFFDPIMLKQLGVMAAIYGLFLFEAIICAFSKDSHHSHHQESKSHGHTHMPECLPKELTLISVKTKSETQLNLSRDSASSLDTEVVEDNKKPPNMMVSSPIFLGMTSLALVITLGDSIHNFGDGLAIGASFTASIRGGLSTSIAVLCHELPHEFGDFVVLLSTGLSFSRALLINFLSGLTCFAGLFIGIVIGDDENARRWIMAVTAGIFLYVALTELLPELKEHKKGSPTKTLLMKNIGILAGTAIMVIISIYEHKITIDAF